MRLFPLSYTYHTQHSTATHSLGFISFLSQAITIIHPTALLLLTQSIPKQDHKTSKTPSAGIHASALPPASYLRTQTVPKNQKPLGLGRHCCALGVYPKILATCWFALHSQSWNCLPSHSYLPNTRSINNSNSTPTSHSSHRTQNRKRVSRCRPPRLPIPISCICETLFGRAVISTFCFQALAANMATSDVWGDLGDEIDDVWEGERTL